MATTIGTVNVNLEIWLEHDTKDLGTAAISLTLIQSDLARANIEYKLPELVAAINTLIQRKVLDFQLYTSVGIPNMFIVMICLHREIHKELPHIVELRV